MTCHDIVGISISTQCHNIVVYTDGMVYVSIDMTLLYMISECLACQSSNFLVGAAVHVERRCYTVTCTPVPTSRINTENPLINRGREV